MYTWEINGFLQERNFKISHSDYCYLIATTPQISNVKYADKYKIVTTDRGNFEFEVEDFIRKGVRNSKQKH